MHFDLVFSLAEIIVYQGFEFPALQIVQIYPDFSANADFKRNRCGISEGIGIVLPEPVVFFCRILCKIIDPQIVVGNKEIKTAKESLAVINMSSEDKRSVIQCGKGMRFKPSGTGSFKQRCIFDCPIIVNFGQLYVNEYIDVIIL